MEILIKKSELKMELPVLNLHAAGIDVGSMLMTVSYTANDGCTYLFESTGFTRDLKVLAKTLTDAGVTDAAMEATGVYWTSLFELLEDAGIRVTLINPAHYKNVAAQKTDIKDSQWIHQLHMHGLLRHSHIASDHFRELRNYIHERGVVQKQKSDTLNRIHRLLTLMNIKVQHLISDMEGVGGMKLLRAIAAGTSDPVELLSLIDTKRFKASQEELLESLQGIYKEQFVTLLDMKLKEYDFFREQMLKYDNLIEYTLKKMIPVDTSEIENRQDEPPKSKYYRKNQYSFDVEHFLKQIFGVDLMEIKGFDEKILLDILCVVGSDLNKWADADHFVSWLNLSPRAKISGGKKLGHQKRITNNPATQAFRLAARSLWNSKTPMGALYRKLSATKGPATANKAVARKLARLFYILVSRQQQYDPSLYQKKQDENEKREIAKMKKMADRLGFFVKKKVA